MRIAGLGALHVMQELDMMDFGLSICQLPASRGHGQPEGMHAVNRADSLYILQGICW